MLSESFRRVAEECKGRVTENAVSRKRKGRREKRGTREGERTLKEVEKERNSIGERTSGAVKNSLPLLAFPM